MGFLETLSGRKKVLSFEIIFDDNNNVGVTVNKNVPVVATPDYIRLWSCYEAKMIYNLGYPNNISANMAIGAMAKIVKIDINENTNCFQKANLNDVIHYTSNISKGNIKFTGEFYAKGSTERTIKTWLPLRCKEQQVVYSALALMQYTINMICDDKECLNVFTKTARNMISLYESGMGIGISSIVQVPTLAYMQAIGVV
jgi:WD40 repeat protein